MRRSPAISILAVFLVLAATLPLLAKPKVDVGSKRFTESYVLGEIVTDTVQAAGEADAEHRPGLGNTGIVFAALRNGAIDVYPEYTGTIWQELLKQKGQPNMVSMKRQLVPLGLAVGVPLGFNDTYALAMRDDQAQQLGIRSISDLARHPELRVSVSHEFLNRADGWPGVKKAYDLPFAPTGIDHGLAYAALAAKHIDVTDIYSTDAQIDEYHLRVLTDDRNFFPAYDAVLLYRADLPTRLPRTWAALEKLEWAVDQPAMVKMNAAVDVSKRTYQSVAAEWMRGWFQTMSLPGGAAATAQSPTPPFFDLMFGGNFWQLTVDHLRLVFVSLFFAVLVGVPLGIWAAKTRPAAAPILAVTGILQTVPSLALLAFLIPIVGDIGEKPALIALFLYSLLPIVRGTYTGLTDVAPALRESATALGLSPLTRLRLIELPLASRSILSGIKTSAVINVGTATIAAFIGASGYGVRISEGLTTNDTQMMLSGAIPAAMLALLVQFAFDAADHSLIPAGLRLKDSSGH